MKRLANATGRVGRWGAILAVAVALLVTAGCGGGSDSTEGSSDSSSTVAATITKAQLINKGDAICRKTDAVQRSAYNSYASLNPDDVVSKAGREEAVAKVALPPIEAEIQELGALGAPAGDEAEIAQILRTLERSLKVAERNPGAVMSAIPDPSVQRVEKLAINYGFKDCAKAL